MQNYTKACIKLIMNDHFHARRFSNQLPTLFCLGAFVLLLLAGISYQLQHRPKAEQPSDSQAGQASIQDTTSTGSTRKVGKQAYIVGDFCNY